MTGTWLITALRRFQGYEGSAASFRRSHRSVNGVLTGILCAVSGAVRPVFGKATCYG
jgi:hypothetical protein